MNRRALKVMRVVGVVLLIGVGTAALSYGMQWLSALTISDVPFSFGVPENKLALLTAAAGIVFAGLLANFGRSTGCVLGCMFIIGWLFAAWFLGWLVEGPFVGTPIDSALGRIVYAFVAGAWVYGIYYIFFRRDDDNGDPFMKLHAHVRT